MGSERAQCVTIAQRPSLDFLYKQWIKGGERRATSHRRGFFFWNCESPRTARANSTDTKNTHAHTSSQQANSRSHERARPAFFRSLSLCLILYLTLSLTHTRTLSHTLTTGSNIEHAHKKPESTTGLWCRERPEVCVCVCVCSTGQSQTHFWPSVWSVLWTTDIGMNESGQMCVCVCMCVCDCEGFSGKGVFNCWFVCVCGNSVCVRVRALRGYGSCCCIYWTDALPLLSYSSLGPISVKAGSW